MIKRFSKQEADQYMADYFSPDSSVSLKGIDHSVFDGYSMVVYLDGLDTPRETIWELLPPERRARVERYMLKDESGPVTAPFKGIQAAELLTMEFPDPVWIVEGYLPVGLGFLAGLPKTGKSWLALQLAQAVALGGKFFGQDVEQGTVLYLALEDSKRRLQRRMGNQGWPANKPCDAEFFSATEFYDTFGIISRSENWGKLERQIRARRYRLTVIDTISAAIQGDQNEEECMKNILVPIRSLALELDVAILVIDHHRKAKNESGFSVRDLAGSVSKSATLDTYWGLYREQGKGGASMYTTGRDIEENTYNLMFDYATMCWQCKGEENDESDPKLNRAEQMILNALRARKTATNGEIVEATGLNKGNVSRYLKGLVDKGYVTRTDNTFHCVESPSEQDTIDIGTLPGFGS